MIEAVVLLALILLNGALAMSELAVVSARPARLAVLERAGHKGAAAAAKLAADPGRFLSSVQIGITLVGILSGAFGGATLGRRLSETLAASGLRPDIAEAAGVGAVVVAITYLSLIVGELVPKQLALRNPERVASAVAPAMRMVATVAAPLVWLLDRSGKLVLRLIGAGDEARSGVTEEEIRTMVAEAETAGVVEPEESRMISAVLRLGDRSIRAVMTSRHQVDWIDVGAPPDEVLRRLRESRHSRLPAARGSLEDVIGVVVSKDVVDALLVDPAADVSALVRPAPVILDTLDALDALDALQHSPVHMALVHDEYGQFEGVLTSFDILESIVGSFMASGEADGEAIVARADGSYLVDGMTLIDDLSERLGASFEAERGTQTAAGLVIFAMRHLPSVGEAVDIGGYRFEVVDMDGRRLDRLLVSKIGGD